MTPLDTIAEGERLTQDYYANPTCAVRQCAAQDWLVMHAPALLAVVRAAAELCAHPNTERRTQYERAFADDDALGALSAALQRLKENPDA